MPNTVYQYLFFFFFFFRIMKIAPPFIVLFPWLMYLTAAILYRKKLTNAKALKHLLRKYF